MRMTVVLALMLVLELGCANHTHNPNVTPRATIAGRVSVSGATSPVNNRELVAVDTASGRSYRTHTNDVGDYTFLLPPGEYRLELTLRPNETTAKANPVLQLHDGDIKSDVDIAVVARAGA